MVLAVLRCLEDLDTFRGGSSRRTVRVVLVPLSNGDLGS